jgi:hypothetical protein
VTLYSIPFRYHIDRFCSRNDAFRADCGTTLRRPFLGREQSIATDTQSISEIVDLLDLRPSPTGSPQRIETRTPARRCQLHHCLARGFDPTDPHLAELSNRRRTRIENPRPSPLTPLDSERSYRISASRKLTSRLRGAPVRTVTHADKPPGTPQESNFPAPLVATHFGAVFVFTRANKICKHEYCACQA